MYILERITSPEGWGTRTDAFVISADADTLKGWRGERAKNNEWFEYGGGCWETEKGDNDYWWRIRHIGLVGPSIAKDPDYDYGIEGWQRRP